MSEFKGRILIGVTVAIVAAMALAVAFAVFTPSAFQNSTIVQSTSTFNPSALQLQGYSNQYAPPFNGPWTCGQVDNQVTSGWLDNVTAENTGTSSVTVSALEVGNASYSGPVVFSGNGLNTTVVGPSFVVVIPAHETFFLRFALCQPIHTSDYLPNNVQICTTFAVTLVTSAGNASEDQEALYSPC